MDMSGTPIEVCEGLGLSGLGLGFRLKLKTLWQAVLCHWEVKGLGFGLGCHSMFVYCPMPSFIPLNLTLNPNCNPSPHPNP